jgi:c(7)-type cytochrome triheme protein
MWLWQRQSGWTRRLVAVVLTLTLASGSAFAGKWMPLAKDGIHDPKGPAILELMEPGSGLAPNPTDYAGNQVRWVEALDEGYIKPLSSIYGAAETKVLDRDVIMKRTAQMLYVRFPHRPHTEWLDCKQCHESIFSYKLGETKINMLMILNGQKCGLCHGAVAFPLTECNRCHSVQWRDLPKSRVAQ